MRWELNEFVGNAHDGFQYAASVLISLFSSAPAKILSRKAKKTTTPASHVVCRRPKWITTRPPIQVPPAIPILKADIFSPDATSTASGTNFSACLTARYCSTGTFANAAAPQTNVVTSISHELDAVRYKANNTRDSNKNIILRALIGPCLSEDPSAIQIAQCSCKTVYQHDTAYRSG